MPEEPGMFSSLAIFARSVMFLSFSSARLTLIAFFPSEARLLSGGRFCEIDPGRARSFEALYPRFETGLLSEIPRLRSRADLLRQRVGGPKTSIRQFVILRNIRAELRLHSGNRGVTGNG